MLKEVKYSGQTAQPSDYLNPDGELALSLNLINEDGGLRPIEAPAPLLYLARNEKVLLLHRVAGQENYILLNGDSLCWMKRSDAYTPSTSAVDMGVTLDDIKDITAVGNTLCLATNHGVEYVLWEDGAYKHLGTKPPFVNISFTCSEIGILDDETEVPFEDIPENVLNIIGTKENPPLASPGTQTSGILNAGAYLEKEGEALWAEVINTGMGAFLSRVAEEVTAKGYFHQPFVVRYAYRLYDGSYSWHSAPVLMLPVLYRPIIYVYAKGKKLETKLDIHYFGLSYKPFGNLDNLKDWSDIIAGIDFFVSAPVYTYGLQARESGPALAWKMLYNFNYRQALYDDRLAGIWGGSEHLGPSSVISLSPYNWCIDMHSNDNMEEQLCSQHLFYKVYSAELSELNSAADRVGHTPLSTNIGSLANLTTLPTLPDDYNSHASLIPNFLYAFNQRLIMSDISVMPPKPFPLAAAAQLIEDSDATPADYPSSIKVYTRVNGQKCVSEYISSPDYPIGKTQPRFLYHPDPNAYMMEVTTPAQTYRFALKSHPYLNGGYFWGGLGVSSLIGASADDTTNTVGTLSNKVYISQINNPFLFPVQSIVTVDCRRIYRISTAAKALSQGQFGQYPLYAFTDDGVWALQTSADGTISSRQPITRDVCSNPEGITQIDSAVLFPTDRGIMLISGSQTQCLSDSVNTASPLDLQDFKGFLPLITPELSLQPQGAEAFPSALSVFRDYLKDCRMAYDYAHQHILVFNPSHAYFYIYSLKSHSWGLGYGRLSYSLNSYPEALIVGADRRVLDFSAKTEAAAKGAFISRPLKLDSPDTHKTVSIVIQRGLFQREDVSTILYGSRNLESWHLIWSSKDHYLRGFRGTPYKYFRVAGLVDIGPDESVVGASVQFDQRLTNQPR